MAKQKLYFLSSLHGQAEALHAQAGHQPVLSGLQELHVEAMTVHVTFANLV